MHISKYQIFARIVEEGSLTRTAEIYNYTQSGISHVVKTLEKELGCKLLVRNNKECKLTYEGEILVERIRNIAENEEQLMEAAHAIQGICVGRVRIGTMCSVSSEWLPHIIKRFHADYPNVEFDLVDDNYESTERFLEDGRIDCAFLPYPNSSDISHELLYMDKYYAVLPVQHPMADMDKVPISLFEEEPFIVPTEGLGYRLGDLLKNYNLNLKYNICTKDDVGTLAMVSAGLGVSILSEMFLKCVDTSQVAVKELEVDAYRDLGFCSCRRRELSLATEKFRSYAFQWVKECIK